jgi:hypothetical protein
MYYTQPDYTWIYIVSAIISLIVFIVIFVSIIKISKNTKIIKERLNNVFDRNMIYQLIHFGKVDEAKENILKSFASDCLKQLEKDSYQRIISASTYDLLINRLVEDYSEYIPEINKESLKQEIEKLKKYYLRKKEIAEEPGSNSIYNAYQK